MAEDKKLTQRFNEAFPGFKEKWEAIKKEFNLPVVPAVQAAAPVVPDVPAAPVKEGKLKDGTVINWDTDTLMQGSVITIVDPANPGGFLPAPDGELELEDGTKITIAAGKVTEMVAPEVEAPVDPNMVASLKNENANLKAEVAKVLAQFTAQEKEAKETKVKFEAQTKEIESIKAHLSKVESFMDTLLSIPSAEPIEAQTKLSKHDKLFNKLNK